MVYPLVPPAPAVELSAVFVVDSGTLPSGEKTVRWERVTDPPAGIVRFQLRPAPLSTELAHWLQESVKAVCAPIAAHTLLKKSLDVVAPRREREPLLDAGPGHDSPIVDATHDTAPALVSALPNPASLFCRKQSPAR